MAERPPRASSIRSRSSPWAASTSAPWPRSSSSTGAPSPWRSFLWWVAGSLGIGMGYHRLLTHRGYKTPKWVEYFLTMCGTLALEGGPIFWVATHRIHHQHSDKEGDPHSPREGTYWAHMGWIFTGKAMHHDTDVLARYVPDLSKDRFHVCADDVALGAAGGRRAACCSAFGGIAVRAVGHVLPHDVRPALHVARELRDAPLGLAPLPDARRLAQQLVGGAADVRRRLAQQPPRAPGVGAPRPGLVRDSTSTGSASRR